MTVNECIVLCMCVYVYIHILHTYIYIYIQINIEVGSKLFKHNLRDRHSKLVKIIAMKPKVSWMDMPDLEVEVFGSYKKRWISLRDGFKVVQSSKCLHVLVLLVSCFPVFCSVKVCIHFRYIGRMVNQGIGAYVQTYPLVVSVRVIICIWMLKNMAIQEWSKSKNIHVEVSLNGGTPKSFHSNRTSHCKPSVLGIPTL